MKKLIILVLTLMVGQVFAQKSNVESAVIYMRNSELEDAKKAIDKAAINADTKDDPKMWSVRAAVYDSIVHNKDFDKLDSSKEEKFIVACLKCMETDTKKRFEEYCGTAILNSGFSAFNKAIEYSNKLDVTNAVRMYDYVLKAIPYDKDGLFKKNGITEKIVIKAIGDMSYMAGNYSLAMTNYRKLIDIGFMDQAVFKFGALSCLIKGDTTRAFDFIDQGRKEFPSNADLINIELNIYLAQGRQNVLLDKLNEALGIDDENHILHFVRGNVYDNFSVKTQKEYKHNVDTAAKLIKKAKVEKNAIVKGKLDAAIKLANRNADSLYKTQKEYSAKAEKDYQKVLEINADYMDAYYNLGVLNNNRTDEIVAKMNSITAATQTEYDKKWNAFKKVQDSILTVSVGYFKKALELAEAMPEDDAQKKEIKKQTILSFYSSLQVAYANLGDEKATIEIMKKRKELENQ